MSNQSGLMVGPDSLSPARVFNLSHSDSALGATLQQRVPMSPSSSAAAPMGIALVGCGYVADLYLKTLDKHRMLNLVGAYDRNPQNLEAFCKRWPTRAYTSLEDVVADPSVGMVLNLTNPRSHYEVTKRCLEADKHVYSEKPLAMELSQAQYLTRLAAEKGVWLSAAPCSLLSETAQTIWKALKKGAIGRPRLAYAEFDDGMIAPKQTPWQWRNGYGVPWPAKDEFEIGATYEHAAYVLTWLAAYFGPARSVTAYSSCQVPDKGIGVNDMAPDFTVGCIEYAEGVVARVTCGLVAPRDKSLTIVGDDGIISTANVRNDAAPVYVRRIPSGRLANAVEMRLNRLRRWLERLLPNVPWSGQEWHFQRKYPFAIKPNGRFDGPDKQADFCRGPAELVQAVRERRPCRLSAQLGVHIVELIEALQYPERFGGTRRIESTLDPIEPLLWTS